MEKRALGRSGITVSCIAVGTVSLGVDYGIAAPDRFGRPPEEESLALLRHAHASGITLYDTAPAYGAAERLLGAALQSAKESVFATKVTTRVTSVEESLGQSRMRLRREQLDIVQIHNATVDSLRDGDLLKVLEEARARGELRYIGASVYQEEEALAAIEAGVDVLQVAYNLLDQRMAQRVFPAAVAAGVGIFVRSAFLKGVLTDKAVHLPAELTPLKQFADRARERLGIDWSSLTEIALRFCLSHPAVTSVLVGVRTRNELDAALAAEAAGPLPQALLAETASIAVDDERLLNPSNWPIA